MKEIKVYLFTEDEATEILQNILDNKTLVLTQYLDCFVAETCKRLKAVTESNYSNYVKKVMKKSGMYMGGTEYAPVLDEVVTYYKDIEPSEIPAFVIFITDGDNSDHGATDKIVRELSKYNIFVQFIGIGDDNFSYLKKLDKLDGREADNTGFTSVEDMDKMTDEELYTEILRQYKDWLNNK